MQEKNLLGELALKNTGAEGAKIGGGLLLGIKANSCTRAQIVTFLFKAYNP